MVELLFISGLSVAFLANLFSATVTAATPLILAALGEIAAERGGMLNLGVEGIMLMGALGSFVVALTTGNLALGFLAGTVIGVIAGALHAFLCVSLNADQVISGLMITLLGSALTAFLGTGWTNRSVDGLNKIYFPVIGEPLSVIPVFGEGLFYSTPTDFLALLLVPVVWYVLFRTNLGKEIISAGEGPESADTIGVPVFQLRYGVTIFGGALAGFAGAHLILGWINQWSTGMTAGFGWIAIALVIVSRWRPFGAVLVAYLFASLNALQIRVQGLELGNGIVGGLLLDPSFMAMYPYVATIIVLAWASRNESEDRLGRPEALAQVYKREE